MSNHLVPELTPTEYRLEPIPSRSPLYRKGHVTNNPTPEQERAAWELIELADVSRHPSTVKLRELIKEHGRHSQEVLKWAMLITRGKVHGTFLDMAAVNWAAQQSRQNEVPPFYLDRARRLLDPHNTPPDYVDAYRTLAGLCPGATHWTLDEAARRLAGDPAP